jgi:hypothetical protein
MKKDLLYIQGKISVNASLSFRKFLEEMNRHLEEAEPYRQSFYASILEEFNKNPHWLTDMDLQRVGGEEALLQVIHIALFPPLSREETFLWGLSLPLQPTIFYGTDELYQLIKGEKLETWGQSVPENNEMTLGQLKLIYSFIVRQCYNYSIVVKNQIVRPFTDKESGLLKYYQIHQDLRFITVSVEGELPELDFEMLKTQMNEQTALAYLYRVLPLERFHFKGFSVLTVSDITIPYVVEKVKNEILRVDHSLEATYTTILKMLPSLIGNSHIHFGLLPFFELNKKLITPFEMVFPYEVSPFSLLMQAAVEFQVDPDVFSQQLEHYRQNPQVLLELITEEVGKEESIFHAILRKKGVRNYALIPVRHNGHPVGILEVYARREGTLTNKCLTILEVAIPTLGQLLQKGSQDFKAAIDRIIKNKFTPLQPAVLWKFKEAAWHYLQKQLRDNKAEMETIQFKEVYPLYGSVDIRNSTRERNEALLLDLQVQFTLLLEVLNQLLQRFHLPLLEELVFRGARLHKSIVPALNAGEEQALTGFLEQEIHPILLEIKATYPTAGTIIAPYLAALDKNKGQAYQHRRVLETAMETLTTAVSNYLDAMKEELQQSNPCYFESLRTDGIEYDIYIGQSIAPEKPFSMSSLKNLRLWQLKSMSTIARMTHALLPDMPTPLHTTQLIFIHSTAVDICFRNNERRFDVEGGANIRYQIIKKRIDKVHVGQTNERLTQPGKIALVYSDNRDAEQYLSYIQFLQEQQVLTRDLEYLELEQLQGVAGLKALRVGVNLEHEAVLPEQARPGSQQADRES